MGGLTTSFELPTLPSFLAIFWKKAGAHDSVSKVAQQRLSVLELAQHVSEACRRRGMDPTRFQEWKQRSQMQGFEGLKDQPPVHKSHSQTKPPEAVKWIKALALERPPPSH